MIHYGYYVLLHDGRLIRAGDDWGPTADSYKPGDSMGTRNGVEGIVVGVVKGNGAKQYASVDVMVIVDEQPAKGARNPLPRDLVTGVMIALNEPPSSPGPATIQTLWNEKNVRVVAIWNKVIFRQPTETFHEFLIEVPLKWSFGEEWHKAELSKPDADRHIVMRWLTALGEEIRKHQPADHQSGQVYGASATGEVTELVALAHNMYMLQKVDRLPDGVMNRLRNYDGFQGARYEIAIAAAFVKCDFEIEWIDEKASKHPEFIARNPRTREEVAVETKSRRRPGVLHHPGTLPPADELRADVDRLYRDALQQDPGNRPFAIFLDVNLPPNTSQDDVAQWQRELVVRWQPNEQLALLGFTNFAWHYSGTAVGRRPEFLLSVPTNCARPLANAGTLRHLQLVLDMYGVCPNEY
jgi:hypothetical protein